MVSFSQYKFEDIQYFKFGYGLWSKPKLFVYSFFVDGLLIDTGQRNARKEVIKSTSGLKVDQIFITHHHEDHTGNIRPIQKQFNCPVYASKRCCELMKNPPPISLAQKMVWGDRPSYHLLKPIDGEIKTPNYTFKLYPIPGHAVDMIALYEPQMKWLFSSDLFVNSYIGYALKNESILQQITSIRQILQLDFDVLLCSHNPRLSDGREKLTNKLLFLEDFYGQVAYWHHKGFGLDAIYKAMSLKEHGFIHLLSHGFLSKKNMVRSAIRDINMTNVSFITTAH